MGIYMRKDTGKWGFRYREGSYRLKPYSDHRYGTKIEAQVAQEKFLRDPNKWRLTTLTSLEEVIDAYLENSDKVKHRSKERLQGLWYNYQHWIIPFFGATTPIAKITFDDVERFVAYQSDQGKKPKTCWNTVTDLRSVLNWAIKRDLLVMNPVNKADLSLIADRQSVKMPLHEEEFDVAAGVLTGMDKAWFNFARFTGLRRSEANRLQWSDLDLDRGLMTVPGKKTKGSTARAPIAPILIRELLALKTISDPSCPWVFPGPEHHSTEGQQVKHRRRMFERVQKLTGIKITAKDCRDYFATVTIKKADISTVSKLLRHTNIKTTSLYLRTVDDRMRAAVENLGK